MNNTQWYNLIRVANEPWKNNYPWKNPWNPLEISLTPGEVSKISSKKKWLEIESSPVYFAVSLRPEDATLSFFMVSNIYINFVEELTGKPGGHTHWGKFLYLIYTGI